MLTFVSTNRFKKDLQQMLKRGKSPEKFKAVIALLLTHVTQPDADSGPAVIPAKAGICEKRGFLLSQE